MSTVTWDVCQRLGGVFLRVCVHLIRLLSLLNAVASCHTPSNHFLFQLRDQTAVMIGQKTDCKTPEVRRFFMNNKLTDCYRRTSESVAATGNSSHQIKPSFKNHEFSGFEPDATHKVGEGKKQKWKKLFFQLPLRMLLSELRGKNDTWKKFVKTAFQYLNSW